MSTREKVESAHAAWSEAGRQRADSPLSVALDAAQRVALKEFATSRGWSISKRWITPEDLRAGRIRGPQSNRYHPQIDHSEYFIDASRRPAAILTHSYAPWESLTAFAERQGLDVERLAYSWYYPGGCIAAVLTPKADPESAARDRAAAGPLADALARANYFRIADRVAWWPPENRYAQIMWNEAADHRAMLRTVTRLKRPPYSKELWREIVSMLPDMLEDRP